MKPGIIGDGVVGRGSEAGGFVERRGFPQVEGFVGNLPLLFAVGNTQSIGMLWQTMVVGAKR